jgi:hypothetical protein
VAWRCVAAVRGSCAEEFLCRKNQMDHGIFDLSPSGVERAKAHPLVRDRNKVRLGLYKLALFRVGRDESQIGLLRCPSEASLCRVIHPFVFVIMQSDVMRGQKECI